jgi:hypothetical protein
MRVFRSGISFATVVILLGLIIGCGGGANSADGTGASPNPTPTLTKISLLRNRWPRREMCDLGFAL